eukprot:scaffold1229_cov193-Alexandrium_tamarense.AAC.20
MDLDKKRTSLLINCSYVETRRRSACLPFHNHTTTAAIHFLLLPILSPTTPPKKRPSQYCDYYALS